MDEELKRIISSLPPDYQQIVLNMSDKEIQAIFGISPKLERKSRSIVELYKQYTSECHYCTPSSPNGQISFGLDATQITVQDYQDLIDKGWRRSGSWIYHPYNELACCPSYTIRLDVRKFKATKAQKFTMKKFHKFLNRERDFEDVNMKESNQDSNNNINNNPNDSVNNNEIQNDDVNNNSKSNNNDEKPIEIQQKIRNLEREVNEAFLKSMKKLNLESMIEGKGLNVIISEVKTKKLSKVKGCLSTNICLRLTPYLTPPLTPISIANCILSFLPPSIEATVEGDGFINFNMNYRPQRPRSTSQNLMDSISYNNESLLQPRKFEFSMERSSFTQEKFNLYKKYQSKIHKENEDELTEKNFAQFLVNSPLIYQKATSSADPEEGYGSFHQLYRIDGKLIAVGVVDILPYCLSSVYFFYDPDYSFLAPGVLSALTEINWVSKISVNDKNTALNYYYMGYYIHSCPKMKYKAGYQPSDLLCPITYTWWPLSDILEKLNEKKYVQFAPDDTPNKISPTDSEITSLIRRLTLLLHGKEVKVDSLTSQGQRIVQSQIAPFVQLIGCPLASKFCYKFN